MPYRPNVCLLIYNENKELFIGERISKDLSHTGVWQLPQGGIDLQEELPCAALREAREELGTADKFLNLVKILNATHEYDFDQIPKYAKNRWRGQRQNFALIKFNGSSTDINLNLHEAEFSSWRWVTAHELISQVEPKRRQGYQAALDEFVDLINTNRI